LSASLGRYADSRIRTTLPRTVGPGTPSADEPSTLKAWDGLSDEELLVEMVKAHAAHESVDRGVAQLVAALRGSGVSWARTGEALAVTRQSASERFSGEE